MDAVGVDIGSNTISCCRISPTPSGNRIVRDKSMAVRLSEGLMPGGTLKPAAVMRALDALERMHAEFEMAQCRVRAAATAVLRMTGAPQDFLAPAQEVLGVPVEVISGMEEARLTGSGAMMDLPPVQEVSVLDIGGQSTEISRIGPDGAFEAVSMELGVVALTERFFATDVIHPEALAAGRRHVDGVLASHLSGWTPAEPLVSVGGTPTTLSLLERRLTGWHKDKVHGDCLSLAAVNGWLRLICAATPKERIDRYGMKPMRADVFPAGLLVLSAVMERYGVPRFTVSANGLRVGLALSVLG